MDGGLQPFSVLLEGRVLAGLMPMHVAIAADGSIRSAGPTLKKILPDRQLEGCAFFDRFEIRRPAALGSVGDLIRTAGRRLHLNPRGQVQDGLRGVAVPVMEPGVGSAGVLVNLTFGVGIIEGVRRHRLSDADFVASDLTMELLYLVEAKSAVMQELRDLNLRLDDAKTAAEAQAVTDPLTGLSNRRGADLRLNGHSASRIGFGLMHMDLDFFKEVNDSFGHAAGDHVLQMVAKVLRAHTRTEDCSARVGGDEFIVILPGMTEEPSLLVLAERIIAEISRPILFNGVECLVSVSIGIAVHRGNSPPDLEHLHHIADQALYSAKHAGRRRAHLARQE